MITSLNNLEFRELNAANDILVVMLDSLGRIIFFNKACEQATGYTFKEVVNRKLWEFFASAEEAEPLRQGLQDFVLVDRAGGQGRVSAQQLCDIDPCCDHQAAAVGAGVGGIGPGYPMCAAILQRPKGGRVVGEQGLQ